MKVERTWAMPNHRTFQIPPITQLLQEEHVDGLLIEPFPFQSSVDCFEYLAKFQTGTADYALIDPPYSNRQRSEHYRQNNIEINGWHTGAGWTAKLKDEVARVMKVGGKCITFGWNSAGIGQKRGFEKTRILLVCHGGDHNDTICTVETKVRNRIITIQEGSD